MSVIQDGVKRGQMHFIHSFNNPPVGPQKTTIGTANKIMFTCIDYKCFIFYRWIEDVFVFKC